MTTVNFAALLPEMKKAVEYIAATATGGVIGNRVDSWFVSLYYHEKQRIIYWLGKWKISEADKGKINGDEKLKVLFSQVISGVANEIFEQKLLIWPLVTESLLRNSNLEFDKKQYFISLFLKLEPFAIHYLTTLYLKGPIPGINVFGKTENMEPKNLIFKLGQLNSAFTGCTEIDGGNFVITTLGKSLLSLFQIHLLKK